MTTAPKPIEVVRQRVGAFLKDHSLTGIQLVVAVSGGPDSVCLLHTLWTLRGTLRLDLHVAHLDHQLRGMESSGDAAYVTELCRHLGAPITAEAVDVAAYRQQHRLTLEEAARDVRYAFLCRVAKGVGASAVMLGHTADDQAETVLMHVLRGTSVSGLRGMEAITQRDGATLARPLLTTDRYETEAYCAAAGLMPRTDTSNLKMEHTRNRVRLELMPLLRQFNPQVQSALNRLARNAGDLTRFIELETDEAWRATTTSASETVRLDRRKVLALPPILQIALLRRAIEHLRGLRHISETHLDRALRLLAGPAGKRMDLPGALTLSVDYEEVTLMHGNGSDLSRPASDGEMLLKVPGLTVWEGWEIRVELVSEVASATGQDMHEALLDASLATAPLVVRARRPGDRFHPVGLKGTKKLQDFMVDAKITQRLRDRVPLLCRQERILWVVGYRLAEGAAAHDSAALHVSFRKRPVD